MTIDRLKTDLQRQPEAFRRHRDKILAIGHQVEEYAEINTVLMTGIATSLYALEGACYQLASEKVGVAELINTCDLLDYGYPQSRDKRPLIILSRSGESAEIIRLIDIITGDRVVIGITEGRESPLAKRADVLLDFEAKEAAFPNTLSFFLSQIYALAIVKGLGFAPEKDMGDLLNELDNLLETILGSEGGLEIGEMVADSDGVLLEGQGDLTGVVHQYALDFHETRTVCVPIVGGIMRHGPIELTQQTGLVTMMLIPHDSTAARKIAIAEELCSEGKKVAVLTNGTLSIDERINIFRLPECSKELNSLVFTAGMQKVYESYVMHKGLVDLTPSLVGKVTRKE